MDLSSLKPEDPELQALLALARDPETPSAELLRIHRHPLVARLRYDAKADPYVYTDYPGHNIDLPARREAYLSALDAALAEHPNVPLELQAHLARSGHGVDLAMSPHTAPQILAGLIEGTYGPQPALQHRMLLANPATPAEALEWIARRTISAEDLEAVLRHRNASVQARDTAAFLLGRADASEATIREIVRAGDRLPAYRVAEQTGTPATILADLLAARPRDYLMTAQLAAHPNATPELLQAIAQILADQFPSGGKGSWRDAPESAQDTLAALCAHPAADAGVLAPVADVARLHGISADERLRLAADPHTDPATLAMLAELAEDRVLRALAENPATPAALLETFLPRSWRDRIASRWRRLGLSVTRNPAAAPDLLRRLHEYFMSAKPPVPVTGLLNNPNTPADIRASIAVRHLLVNPLPVRALAVAPDGSWLAAAGDSTEVLVWDAETGTVRHTLQGQVAGIGGVQDLMTVPDGGRLAVAESGGILQLWDPLAGTADGPLPGDTGRVHALVAAPDGSWLAGAGVSSDAGYTPWLRVWDRRDGSIRHDLTGQAGWVEALAAAPDGAWLASAGFIDAVRLWDPRTGAAIRTLSRGRDDRPPRGRIEVTTLAVAPHGRWLAVGGQDGIVWIWDPHSGALRHTLTGHTGPVTRLAPAPDGSWLASASRDCTVRIWDPDTGQARHTLTGHTGGLEALAVAPDGRWLAVGGQDGIVWIWDPHSGALRHTLTGHTGPVTQLAPAPDGSWLASASLDYTVRLWDPRTGLPRAEEADG